MLCGGKKIDGPADSGCDPRYQICLDFEGFESLPPEISPDEIISSGGFGEFFTVAPSDKKTFVNHPLFKPTATPTDTNRPVPDVLDVAVQFAFFSELSEKLNAPANPGGIDPAQFEVTDEAIESLGIRTPITRLNFRRMEDMYDKFTEELRKIKKRGGDYLTPKRSARIDHFLELVGEAFEKEETAYNKRLDDGADEDASFKLSRETRKIFGEAALTIAAYQREFLARSFENGLRDFEDRVAGLIDSEKFDKAAKKLHASLARLRGSGIENNVNAKEFIGLMAGIMSELEAWNLRLAIAKHIEVFSDPEGVLARTREDFEIQGKSHYAVPKKEYDAAIGRLKTCLKLIDRGDIVKAGALFLREIESDGYSSLTEFIEAAGVHSTIVSLEISVLCVLAGALPEIGISEAMAGARGIPAVVEISTLYLRGITFAAYNQLARYVLQPEVLDQYAKATVLENSSGLLIDGLMMGGLFGTLKYGGYVLNGGLREIAGDIERNVAGALAKHLDKAAAAKAAKGVAGLFEKITGFFGEAAGLFALWEYLEPVLRVSITQEDPEFARIASEHAFTKEALKDRLIFLGVLRFGHLLASPVTGKIRAGFVEERKRPIIESFSAKAREIFVEAQSGGTSYQDAFRRLVILHARAAKALEKASAPEEAARYMATGREIYEVVTRGLQTLEEVPALEEAPVEAVEGSVRIVNIAEPDKDPPSPPPGQKRSRKTASPLGMPAAKPPVKAMKTQAAETTPAAAAEETKPPGSAEPAKIPRPDDEVVDTGLKKLPQFEVVAPNDDAPPTAAEMPGIIKTAGPEIWVPIRITLARLHYTLEVNSWLLKHRIQTGNTMSNGTWVSFLKFAMDILKEGLGAYAITPDRQPLHFLHDVHPDLGQLARTIRKAVASTIRNFGNDSDSQDEFDRIVVLFSSVPLAQPESARNAVFDRLGMFNRARSILAGEEGAEEIIPPLNTVPTDKAIYTLQARLLEVSGPRALLAARRYRQEPPEREDSDAGLYQNAISVLNVLNSFALGGFNILIERPDLYDNYMALRNFRKTYKPPPLPPKSDKPAKSAPVAPLSPPVEDVGESAKPIEPGVWNPVANALIGVRGRIGQGIADWLIAHEITKYDLNMSSATWREFLRFAVEKLALLVGGATPSKPRSVAPHTANLARAIRQALEDKDAPENLGDDPKIRPWIDTLIMPISYSPLMRPDSHFTAKEKLAGFREAGKLLYDAMATETRPNPDQMPDDDSIYALQYTLLDVLGKRAEEANKRYALKAEAGAPLLAKWGIERALYDHTMRLLDLLNSFSRDDLNILVAKPELYAKYKAIVDFIRNYSQMPDPDDDASLPMPSPDPFTPQPENDITRFPLPPDGKKPDSGAASPPGGGSKGGKIVPLPRRKTRHAPPERGGPNHNKPAG